MSLLRAATIILLPTLTLGAVLVTASTGPLEAAANQRGGKPSSQRSAQESGQRSGQQAGQQSGRRSTQRSTTALPTARLAGVMVNPVIDEAAEFMPAHAFQGAQAQTKLCVTVDMPGGGIIGFDRAASRAVYFKDSTGRSLLEDDAAFGPFGFGERVLRGGSLLAVELDGAMAPSPGATWVSSKGELHVRVAHEQATFTSSFGSFAKGTVLEAGPYKFEVTGYGAADWGDGFHLKVSANASVEGIISYTAIDQAGTRYVMSVGSTLSWDDHVQMSLHMEESVQAASLEIVAWENPKTLRVPFDVRARVGSDEKSGR